MAAKLTPRQQEILDLIAQTIERTGFPPTRAEIAQALGFRSPNAAEDHLKALAKKGAITLTAGASRGIRLTHATAEAAPGASPGAMASGMPTKPGFGESLAQTVTQTLSHLVLPLIGRVAAGGPILAVEHVDRELSVDPSLFSQRPDYLLMVRGLSMRDAGILDGDLLAVKKTESARDGQIVVARIDDDVTVKRLQRNTQGVQLLPENPDFEPIIVGPGNDFSIEGLAVGLIRPQVWS